MRFRLTQQGVELEVRRLSLFPARLLPSCVTIGKSVYLSGLQFPFWRQKMSESDFQIVQLPSCFQCWILYCFSSLMIVVVLLGGLCFFFFFLNPYNVLIIQLSACHFSDRSPWPNLLKELVHPSPLFITKSKDVGLVHTTAADWPPFLLQNPVNNQ